MDLLVVCLIFIGYILVYLSKYICEIFFWCWEISMLWEYVLELVKLGCYVDVILLLYGKEKILIEN